MKNYLLLLLLFIISCNKNIKTPNVKLPLDNCGSEIIKNKEIDTLIKLIEFYNPTRINLSKESFFNQFDLESIYNNGNFSIEKKKNITNIILLKQYLYHLRSSNQGFDLKSMKRNNGKIIIDYYFKIYKVDTTKEFINTSIAYDKLKSEHIKNKEVINLLEKIRIEIDRIKKGIN